MTINLALEYIPQRMEELGYGKRYSIQFRHFILQPKHRRKIHGNNQIFILIEPVDAISVNSEIGIFDLTKNNLPELQYEHQGSIRIRNYSNTVQQIRFIQVIPKQQ